MNKICRLCKEEKSLEEFTAKENRCKSCNKKRSKEYRKNNPEKARASVLKWQKNNPEKYKKSLKNWNQNNTHKICEYSMRRHARKQKAIPSWANQIVIDAYYMWSSYLRTMGLDSTIDHVVPLKGKNVCGLHVENNLQFLTSSENSIKSNKHWPDMWESI